MELNSDEQYVQKEKVSFFDATKKLVCHTVVFSVVSQSSLTTLKTDSHADVL